MPAEFLYNLTKNLTAHLTRNHCAVLPSIFSKRTINPNTKIDRVEYSQYYAEWSISNKSSDYLYRYVTEGTFDAYNYQLLENKQIMAKQIMTSRSPVRNCDDIDESALDLATIKALCTGNPLIKERMDLEIEITRLSRLKSNHQNTQFRLENEIMNNLPPQIEAAKKRIEGIKADIQHIKEQPVVLDDKGEAVYPGITIGDALNQSKPKL